MKRYIVLLLSALVISCGGGGGDGSSGGGGDSSSGGGGNAGTPGGGNPGNDNGGGIGGGAAQLPAAGARIEESHAAVTLDGRWTNADSRFGWSGGAAVQSDVAGARASFTFTGTSVRWLGMRGRDMGVARVSVDGGPAREVELSSTPLPYRAPVTTIYDLSDGPHTLTIEVVSGRVVVDAFDVQPQTTVSHWQDTDPNARFSAGWTKASTALPWSGNGARNTPELAVTAQETYMTGETVTLPFRGTAISWIGYRGPDGGIALMQVDDGPPVEVDTYSPTPKFQAELFTATGLADTHHTLKITATGRRNRASSSTRIVVDAFDVMTPGRRYEEYDRSITRSSSGNPDAPHWHRNPGRVWSEGRASTSNQTGATLTFRFTGTSVSWIGSRKASAGGTANVYIDGVFVREVRLKETYPIEGYQMTVFRQDGLAPGPHTLMIEVTSRNDGPYVVVDAFDVHP